ncbi:MAG: hypothetical protein ACK5QE_08185, partial [Sphingobacteriia bacterium]
MAPLRTPIFLLLTLLARLSFAQTIYTDDGDIAYVNASPAANYTVTNAVCSGQGGSIQLSAANVIGTETFTPEDLQFAVFPASTTATPASPGWVDHTFAGATISGLSAGSYDLYVRLNCGVHSCPLLCAACNIGTIHDDDWQRIATNVSISASNNQIQAAAPSASASACPGSTGQINIGGITANYSYAESDLRLGLYSAATGAFVAGQLHTPSGGQVSFTGLAPGAYRVYAWDVTTQATTPADNNQPGCYNQLGGTIAVGQQLAFTVSQSTTPAGCLGNDGSVELTISPAGTYYFYDGNTWSPVTSNPFTLDGFAPNAYTGPYQISTSSGGGACDYTLSFVINQGSQLPFSVQHTTTAASCPGATDGSLTLSLSPAGSYYMQQAGQAWVPIPANPYTLFDLPAGTISLAVSNHPSGASCASSLSAVVPGPAAFAGMAEARATGEIMATASGGTGVLRFGVSTNANPPTSFLPSPLQDLPAGTYQVWVQDANS